MKDEILQFLTELDIPYHFEEHPAVFTVAEALEKIEDKRPIKNLLLVEAKGERLVLVIMDGEQKLDTKFLARTLGIKKLQFAKPDILKTTLGVEPGSVSLFGVLHSGSEKVEVIIDESLMGESEIGFHPNLNTATIFIPGSACEKILQKTSHTYRILQLQNAV
jgi:Ala-tRNA(Pro) deacylase